MVIFEIYPYKTKVYAPPTAIPLIQGELTYIDRQTSYLNRFHFRQQDPRRCLFQNSAFLSGLVETVESALKDFGIAVEKHDYSEAVEPQPCDLPPWLYPHQRQIIQTMLKYPRGMIESPTGSGKTLAAAYFLKQFPQTQILFTVPEVALMYKTVEVFQEHLGETIGCVGDGKKDLQRITVGVINSLAKMAETEPETFAEVKVVLHDEAHRAATSYYETLTQTLTAGRIYGLTATAFRESGDTLRMHGLCGPLRLRISEQELAKLGTILRPKYWIINDLSRVEGPYIGAKEVRRGENLYYTYNTPNGKPQVTYVYEKGIVLNRERNERIIRLLQQYLKYHDRGALIFVERINHGEILQEIAAAQGLNLPFLNGISRASARHQAIEDLKSGALRCLCVTAIFNEGQDIPNLGLVIIGNGGANHRRIIQQVGRVVRSAPGKTSAYVIDFLDNEPLYLRQQSRKRFSAIQGRYGDCTQMVTYSQMMEVLARECPTG